jgi:hypothetical protein
MLGIVRQECAGQNLGQKRERMMAFTEITAFTRDGSTTRTMVRSVELPSRIFTGEYYYFGGNYNPRKILVVESGEGPDNRSPIRIKLGEIPPVLFEALLATSEWNEVH